MFRSREWSLANRQLILLATSLTVIAVFLGLAGAWYIQGFTERTSDRVLRASVSSIAETIAIENGKVTLEVPPGAFGMLEDSARDNVYYTVHSGGQTITGYADFPKLSGRPVPADETVFRYDEYLGQEVRVATQARYLPRTAEPVVVEVAETLDERRALTRAMLVRLAMLEAFMVVMAALLIRPAIRWGLSPLTRLQGQIAARGPGEPANRPIETSSVPQELKGLVNTFNLLLERLDAAVRRVRDFTGDASHQMRTPLAALRTHLLLVKRHGTQTAEGETALREVDGAALRLQRLLGQLLALARSDDAVGSSGSNRMRIDLGRTVRDVTAELAPQAVAKGIDIVVDCDMQGLIAADALMISEMLANVIDNAVRYNSAGGRITIRCTADDGRAIIEVEDDGPGIPAEERAAVFNRFYRLKRDRESDGSGLGLAIVESLARATGASVELGEGSQGRGLLVRFTLPDAAMSVKGSRKSEPLA